MSVFGRDRQKKIRRLPRQVLQPQPAPPATPGATSSDVILGKIIEINRIKQDARLAPLKPGVDPRDTTKWGDDANFDLENVICCWTQGFPVCDVGWPATAVKTQAGYVLGYQLQLHAESQEENTFCPPDGTLSPELVADCDPLEDPGICSTRYACCLPAGGCQELTEVGCAASGGIYHGPGTTEGGDSGGHCESEPGGTVTCIPLVGCQDPLDFSIPGCTDVEVGQCTTLHPGWNELQCTCDEWWGFPRVGECP